MAAGAVVSGMLRGWAARGSTAKLALDRGGATVVRVWRGACAGPVPLITSAAAGAAARQKTVKEAASWAGGSVQRWRATGCPAGWLAKNVELQARLPRTQAGALAGSAARSQQLAALSSTPPKPPPGVGKMAHYIKELGLPFTLWWTGSWLITGFAVYGVISSGIVGGADAIDLLRAVGVGRIVDLDNIDPGMGNLAVTIVINEALEVVRLPFVLATTPYVARLIPKGFSLTDLILVHGVPFLVLWSGSWALSGAAIWGVLESGALSAEGAIGLLRAVPGMEQLADLDGVNPAVDSSACVVLAINKCLEVVRLPLCVVLAPRWARTWARIFGRR
mmetsp:Transcript_39077/g.98229  ORF Transcript_39077/g.98229 Transcript_39077/m.98229 type:complete len:334 (+) Transcript_39077:223-1224(+)